MDSEINMTCDDIKRRLQLFLDDLLAEEEYGAFCGHVQNCDRCTKFVRSIGSLTNQLWKLGKVRVPEDLYSTIMFKFSHPELQQARRSLKKVIILKKNPEKKALRRRRFRA